jgi:type IV pilus assembly protein PilA
VSRPSHRRKEEFVNLYAPHDGEGFTLVELMVVVLIIGILVAIAIPVFLNASANAQAKTCQANQRTLHGAVQTAIANGVSTATVVASNADTSTANGWGQLLVPTFVKTIPKCPAATSSNLYHMNLAGLVDGDQSAAAWSNASHKLQ